MDNGILQLTNADISVKIISANYKQRIVETMRNLHLNTLENENLLSIYRYTNGCTLLLDGNDLKNNNREIAFFFENTDYQILIHGDSYITDIRLYINSIEEKTVNGSDNVAFGTINFHNQVGNTELSVHYRDGSVYHIVTLSTEVLSYKLNYRVDMRRIIADIECEYSMLSYSYLKQTYLNFRTHAGISTDLIWWQIFCFNYEHIVIAAHTILRRPNHQFCYNHRYEKIEQLRRITPSIENEFLIFSTNSQHLYYTEQSAHTLDTKENRFFKFVMQSLLQKYRIIRTHLQNTILLNVKLEYSLDKMEEELLGIVNHPFFKNIGSYKKFSQDSITLKKAPGYGEIYRYWIELQCGFDLYEGLQHLEVKDISELYEIWCFIRVKNIVANLLGNQVIAKQKGEPLSIDFVRQLLYGKDSEVEFFSTKDQTIRLVSLMYNATIRNTQDSDTPQSAIHNTTTFTTEQRPDIVLQLKRKDDNTLYTYLFDAKYRISDRQILNTDVPPVEAINQLHRYRDAIYYEDSQKHIKKEIIGGFILFPGTMTCAEYKQSYYYLSAQKVGIGAFPLRPTNLDTPLEYNTEQELIKQINKWLTADQYPKQQLLATSIPQKGLIYSYEMVQEPLVFLSSIDPNIHSQEDKKSIINGSATIFYSGYAGTGNDIDYLRVHYFSPVIDHLCYGYYEVTAVHIIDLGNRNNPMRIAFLLGMYHRLSTPIKYGLDRLAARGVALTRSHFFELGAAIL